MTSLFENEIALRNVVEARALRTVVVPAVGTPTPTPIPRVIAPIRIPPPLLWRGEIVREVPREQVTVPICPTATVTDEVIFEDARQKYYLPRYRIAEETVSGQQRYRIALAASGQGWTLTVYLEAYPAAKIEQEIRDAKIIEHKASVLLSYQWHGQQGELPFQEVTQEAGGQRLKAVLRLNTLEERDSIYLALTDAAYGAILMVRREVKVAIAKSSEVPSSASIVSSGTATIRGTWTFNLETGVEGGNGDLFWQQETRVIRNMVPRNKALIAQLGKVDFDSLTLTQLQKLSYGKTPINGNDDASNQLVNGTVFAVRTNSGHYAKVKVLEYGYNLKIQWVTYQASASTGERTTGSSRLPTPQLVLKGTEDYEVRGNWFTRYRLSVTNWSAFPNELFAPAPNLPPCGLNRNSSRTWVNIYAQDGRRIYGFCAFSAAQHLESLWFAVPKGQAPPEAVYVTLNDRQKEVIYTSNTVSTKPALFREVTEVLDHIVDDTFFFPPLLYAYIFRDLETGHGQGSELIRRQVQWQDKWYSYFQNARERYQIYYLPDSFEIAKRTDSQLPAMSLRFKSSDGSPDPEKMRAELDYYAAPVVSDARLAAAATALERYVSFPLPPGVEGLEFTPLSVDNLKFQVSLPHGDGSPSFEWQRNARVSLQDGIFDTLSLPLIEFGQVWEAIFSSKREKTLFTGEVAVEVESGGNMEKIPFAARFEGDSEMLFDGILDDAPGLLTTYAVELEVATDEVVFDTSRADPIIKILVDLGRETIELTREHLRDVGKVYFPIRNVILGIQEPGKYTYQVQVIYKSGKRDPWQTKETKSEIIYVP